MAEGQSFELMSYLMWNIEDISSKLNLESPIFAVADTKFSMVFQKCDSIYTVSMVPVVEDQQSTIPSYAIETSVSIMLRDNSWDEFRCIQKKTNRNGSGLKQCHIVWKVDTKFSDIDATLEERGNNVTFLCVFGPLGQYQKEYGVDFENPWHEFFCMSLHKLGNDLNQMRLDEDPSFVLKCGDKTLPVHDLILSARSKLFADTLRNKNVLEKEVEIKDMEFEVLENFITYIYSGQLQNLIPSVQLLKKLYESADKYKFQPLKFMASSILVDIVNNAVLSGKRDMLDKEKLCGSPEIFKKKMSSHSPNIMDKTGFCVLLLDLLSMADKHEDKSLKTSIILCIVRNSFILTEKRWTNFREDNVMLAMEVYDIFVNEYEP